jgi:hypothetical protein
MNDQTGIAGSRGAALATAESDIGPPQHDDGASDPRQVAALVLAQTGVVHAKKDELTGAIKTLTDMAHEMARAYVGQLQATQQLARQVKTLEGQVGGIGTERSAV